MAARGSVQTEYGGCCARQYPRVEPMIFAVRNDSPLEHGVARSLCYGDKVLGRELFEVLIVVFWEVAIAWRYIVVING